MRKYINKVVAAYYTKFDPAFLKRFHPYHSDYSRGEDFDTLFERGLEISEPARKEPSLWKRDRFYNLYSALDLVKNISGEIAECGVYRGLSSFLICSKLKKNEPGFTGARIHLVDSFEGLSKPTSADKLPADFAGHFTASTENLKRVLKDFPAVSIYKGWIPDVLKTLKENKYKFVHIDLDLVEPTVGAMEYFLPRMQTGGVIVCDDYAANIWGGTKASVDELINRKNLRALRLSTGQLMIFT